MENFRRSKRHYNWKCRREAEGLTISEFATLIGISEKIYSDAEKGLYNNDQVIYGKITRAIYEHNHSFGERSRKYYRIRLKQAILELKYVETEEELAQIKKHVKIHRQRLNKIETINKKKVA